MNDPYEVKSIPADDPYRSTPLYGRYKAEKGDFTSTTLSPVQIYALCRPDTEMIPDFPNGRHIYAVGRLIIKGHHEIDSVIQPHAFGDANEAAAITLVTKHFPWIPLPTIHFQGKVISFSYRIN
jgi:hypothetical protein